MTPEQWEEQGTWWVVGIRPDNGKIHIVHGPGYPCFITERLCACCACTTCQRQRAILDDATDLLEPLDSDEAAP
jgi:hypothetical protein